MVQQRGGSKRILVVEDDPFVRSTIQNTLNGAGFTVAALPNADKVTKTLAEGDISLAILDLTLPDADGLTLAFVSLLMMASLLILKGQKNSAR